MRLNLHQRSSRCKRVFTYGCNMKAKITVPDEVTISVPNWTKHNIRKDVKQCHWFKLSHNIFDDEKVQRLDSESFKLFIWVLCRCSLYGRDMFTTCTRHATHMSHIRTRTKWFQALNALARNGLVTYTCSQTREEKKREDKRLSGALKPEVNTPKFNPKTAQQEIQTLHQEWVITLKHFNLRDVGHSDMQIARLAKRYGIEQTKCAIIGMRFEQATETFDPAKHCSLHRLEKASNFDKLCNLGSRVAKHPESPSEAPNVLQISRPTAKSGN